MMESKLAKHCYPYRTRIKHEMNLASVALAADFKTHKSLTSRLYGLLKSCFLQLGHDKICKWQGPSQKLRLELLKSLGPHLNST